ncbi:MAG: Ca2+-dependent phosphoinositide-specific phospholipase C [Polyangiales bacterium]
MRSRFVLPVSLLATLSLAAACDDSSGRFPARLTGDFSHPMDATLRMNQLQMLATHNSYHVRLEPSPIPDWDYYFEPLATQLGSEGIRGLELDVHYVDDGTTPPHYEVFHVGGLDAGTTCQLFDDCLAEIRKFSDAHPGHHPLFVQIELKEPTAASVTLDMLDLLDDQIRAVFSDSILVTPDQVRGTHPTLREAIATDGWPTLAVARGRTMFAFDCERSVCLAYANGGTGLDGRVIFADSEPTDPFAAVMIHNSPDANATSLVQQGFFVRVFADSAADVLTGQGDDLAAALASGAQVVSTDFPVARPDTTYVASIPGGTPSRCNPVLAPSGCSSTDIENPAYLGGH